MPASLYKSNFAPPGVLLLHSLSLRHPSLLGVPPRPAEQCLRSARRFAVGWRRKARCCPLRPRRLLHKLDLCMNGEPFLDQLQRLHLWNFLDDRLLLLRRIHGNFHSLLKYLTYGQRLPRSVLPSAHSFVDKPVFGVELAVHGTVLAVFFPRRTSCCSSLPIPLRLELRRERSGGRIRPRSCTRATTLAPVKSGSLHPFVAAWIPQQRGRHATTCIPQWPVQHKDFCSNRELRWLRSAVAVVGELLAPFCSSPSNKVPHVIGVNNHAEPPTFVEMPTDVCGCFRHRVIRKCFRLSVFLENVLPYLTLLRSCTCWSSQIPQMKFHPPSWKLRLLLPVSQFRFSLLTVRQICFSPFLDLPPGLLFSPGSPPDLLFIAGSPDCANLVRR